MSTKGEATAMDYVLDENVGFLLRQAGQRHLSIFAEHMPETLTATQFAAIAKIREIGPCSQNRLGRLTAMDAATIKGVIDRLTLRGLTRAEPDPDDGRMLLISLTRPGQELADRAVASATAITRLTLAPLTEAEQGSLLLLLRKLTAARHWMTRRHDVRPSTGREAVIRACHPAPAPAGKAPMR